MDIEIRDLTTVLPDPVQQTGQVAGDVLDLGDLLGGFSLGEAFDINFGVENAFDKAYQDHVAGINRANGSDIPVGVRLYGVERSASVGATWSF